MLAADVIPIIPDDQLPGGLKVKILSFVSSVVMSMNLSGQSVDGNSVDGNKLLLGDRADKNPLTFYQRAGNPGMQ